MLILQLNSNLQVKAWLLKSHQNYGVINTDGSHSIPELKEMRDLTLQTDQHGSTDSSSNDEADNEPLINRVSKKLPQKRGHNDSQKLKRNKRVAHRQSKRAAALSESQGSESYAESDWDWN